MTNTTHGHQTLRHSIGAIREALSYVASSGMPAQHKSVLMDVIGQVLETSDQDPISNVAAPISEPWQTQEVELIGHTLKGRSATSWQNADELVMNLANRLNRRPDEVKAKATDLGFGAGVDFRVAKSLLAHEDK
jgi:hypothetical protein